jgi:hypothetical protein
LLPLRGDLHGLFNVRSVRGFIATDEEQNNNGSDFLEVDPIPWSEGDPHFADAAANRLDVARIAAGQSLDPDPL